MIIDNRLHNVAQIGGRIRVEYYGKVVRKNEWKTETQLVVVTSNTEELQSGRPLFIAASSSGSDPLPDLAAIQSGS